MSAGDMPTAEDTGEREGLFADINITPLTDIFLVLLIVFMITSSVVTRRVRGGAPAPAVVPAGSAAPSQLQQPAIAQKGGQGAQPVVVQIGQRGELWLDGQKRDWKDLRKEMERRSQQSPDQRFEIQPASGVVAGTLMDVLEMAQRVGIKHISVARKQEGDR